MAIFNLFRKRKKEVKEIEGVADKLIEHVIGFIGDKGCIKGELKEIKKIRELPTLEREAAYIPIYLRLERAITEKKAPPTKEYFSKESLQKQEGLAKEDVRKEIREKIDISKLSDKFRVLFLNEAEQSLILYELLCQEFIDLLPSSTRKKIISAVSPETCKDLLAGVTVEKDRIDFSGVNKKIKNLTIEKITPPFRQLFLALYNKVVERSSKNSANEVVKNVYFFVEEYGYPLNAAALRILPVVSIKEAEAVAAHSLIDYVTGLIAQKDLIMPQIEKIKNIELLSAEKKKKAYVDIYLQLEKIILEHVPPAVQKKYTQEELRREIGKAVQVQYLGPEFRLLFLQGEERVIDLFMDFYRLFVKNISSGWRIIDIQKFVSENSKGVMQDVCISEEGMDFSLVETKIGGFSEEELKKILWDLSLFLPKIYRQAEEIAGEEKAKKAIDDAFSKIKEQYGKLPVFNDFIREIPEGVLAHKKEVLLLPKAAEEVVKYVTEILKKEDIGEHLKALEEARKLPVEERSEAFFNIYLNLQHYIIEQRPSFKRKEISLEDLKEKIRKHVNVKDLEDKFQLLFLTQDQVLVKLVGDLIKECVANFIDKKALVEAEKELIKKNRFLKNVQIDETGLIDFEPFLVKLKTIKVDKVKILYSTLSKVVSAVYGKAKNILGESQAKKLFGAAYSALQQKYGANLLQILKVIPKGVLEAEKFELLGKEEIEKTAKEMVKIDVLKGEFMNIAAHELKTPLVPIISYLEMLLNDKRIPRDQKEKIGICLSSAKREADLVSDILDISKLEAGSLKFEFETFDMAELLREATDGLGPAVKQKKLDFKVEVPPKLPLVKGDRRRLTQVVSNLINNATKFTEKGGITVQARREGQDILVNVTDTGMGISKENAKKLFTKFFQVDTAARRKHGGTGLGLAICKGIVQGHKGKMWVEGELGKGTTFFFTVPILQGKMEVKEKPKEEKVEEEKQKEETPETEKAKEEKTKEKAKSVKIKKKVKEQRIKDSPTSKSKDFEEKPKVKAKKTRKVKVKSKNLKKKRKKLEKRHNF
jgi:signal transduction histidine kinase